MLEHKGSVVLNLELKTSKSLVAERLRKAKEIMEKRGFKLGVNAIKDLFEVKVEKEGLKYNAVIVFRDFHRFTILDFFAESGGIYLNNIGNFEKIMLGDLGWKQYRLS
ncbi:MAG: hypothetical protein ASUL_03184 [Candidatus Aramenus sulfurataquae]|jgi:hypothetical protein|uniref:Uncharacterized protein n=2 Tax=Candidatus Aramenus sulfurataquae TaxID=1326980 RepID=W7L733_9CREN|nr:MAG: hypothetical protein ASUL_03184 [Candidatus Aramenus sulfurataquae]